MTPLNFVSLDVETMTGARTSACAIGMVKVLDGVISTKLYTLIKPIPDDKIHNNSHVHGITPDMVETAPTFEEFFPTMKAFIGDLGLICHNASFDIDVIEKCMQHYGLTGIDTWRHFCTYRHIGQSLENACKVFNIDMGTHHDALDDAIACAKVFLAMNDVKCREASPQPGQYEKKERDPQKVYERSTLDKLDDECIDDKSTPFYGAKVVITGTFSQYPNRNRIGKALQSLGADINTSISKRTNIVVVGDDAGPAKLEKVADLQAEGYDIVIMDENELDCYISDIY